MVSALKRTSEKVGMLYPIILDKHGNVIDGQHRLAVNPAWPTVTLSRIASEEERLLARLISNVCRRNVPASEKTRLLEALGQIYAGQGTKSGELAYQIAEKTGMSYTWVMKYLPSHLKARPGLGGPSTRSMISESNQNYDKSQVTGRVTPILDSLFTQPRERIVTVRNFSNTDLVSMLIKKKFYIRLEQTAEKLGVASDDIINNALLLAVEEMEKLAKHPIGRNRRIHGKSSLDKVAPEKLHSLGL